MGGIKLRSSVTVTLITDYQAGWVNCFLPSFLFDSFPSPFKNKHEPKCTETRGKKQIYGSVFLWKDKP